MPILEREDEDDEPDPEESDEGQPCPFCRATEECEHLLGFADETFGESSGVFESLTRELTPEAAPALLAFILSGRTTARASDPLLEVADALREEELDPTTPLTVKQVAAWLPKSAEWTSYLTDTYYSRRGVRTTSFFSDYGGPGTASTLVTFYARNPERVWDAALKAIRRDLRGLGVQPRAARRGRRGGARGPRTPR